jgi:hypothetical protein
LDVDGLASDSSSSATKLLGIRDFQRLVDGEVTEEDILRAEMARRGEGAPTAAQLAEFHETVEEHKGILDKTMKSIAQSLVPQVNLARRVGVSNQAISDALSVDTILPLMALSPDPSPARGTVDAVNNMNATLAAELRLTTQTLSQIAANAVEAGKDQQRWNRIFLGVAVTAVIVAVLSLVVAIVAA